MAVTSEFCPFKLVLSPNTYNRHSFFTHRRTSGSNSTELQLKGRNQQSECKFSALQLKRRRRAGVCCQGTGASATDLEFAARDGKNRLQKVQSITNCIFYSYLCKYTCLYWIVVVWTLNWTCLEFGKGVEIVVVGAYWSNFMLKITRMLQIGVFMVKFLL